MGYCKAMGNWRPRRRITPMNKTLLALGALSLAGCNTPKLQYQAWDASFPEVSPMFDTWEEAEQYALENNMNGDGDFTGHTYEIREINYKYEVRLQNDAVDDQLYTSDDLDSALEYVKVYGQSHDDIYIYNVRTGTVWHNTP